MDFFEGLERAWGLEAFGWFRKRLFGYLGPYKLMLRETCKRFYFKRVGADNWTLQRDCYNTGNIVILDYMLEKQWLFAEYPSIYVAHLSVLQWAEKHPYIIRASDIFQQACAEGHLEIIGYCIKRKFESSLCFSAAEKFQVLNFLLQQGILPETPLSLDAIYTEEKLCWMLNYQHIDCFKFANCSRFTPLRFIGRAVSLKWTNTLLLKAVLEELECKYDEWKYPLPRCRKLTPAVAKAFPANNCWCGDPKNHEQRQKKIKI